MISAAQNTAFSTNYTLNIRGRIVNLATPKVMGVLNITDDSFYTGSRHTEEAAILNTAEEMLRDGAMFLDVGAYSSRPGAAVIPEEDELRRAVRAVETIIKSFPEAIVSADTFRSRVAKACVESGATMVNDISAGRLDVAMVDTVAALHVPYIVMHMRGTPQTMTSETTYTHLIKEIIDYFHQRIAECRSKGIKDIIIDPGFGFAKTVAQNFVLLKNLASFAIHDLPILTGLSRKSMIWRTLDLTADDALNGTTALNSLALAGGANILRVHDVKQAVETVKLFGCLMES